MRPNNGVFLRGVNWRPAHRPRYERVRYSMGMGQKLPISLTSSPYTGATAEDAWPLPDRPASLSQGRSRWTTRAALLNRPRSRTRGRRVAADRWLRRKGVPLELPFCGLDDCSPTEPDRGVWDIRHGTHPVHRAGNPRLRMNGVFCAFANVFHSADGYRASQEGRRAPSRHRRVSRESEDDRRLPPAGLVVESSIGHVRAGGAGRRRRARSLLVRPTVADVASTSPDAGRSARTASMPSRMPSSRIRAAFRTSASAASRRSRRAQR